jgi:hypothetical protein
MRPRSRQRITGTLVLCALVGCSAESIPRGEPFTVPEMIEPIVVRLELGEDAATPMPFLFNPMAFLPDGRLVARSARRKVWMFGSDGAFLAEFGRDGEGPGEFRGITGLSVRGDTVEIGDPTLSRLTYWLPDTDEVWTEPWNLPRSASRGGFSWNLTLPGVRATGGPRLVEGRAIGRMGAANYEFFPVVLRLDPPGADPVFLASALTVQRSRMANLGGTPVRVHDGQSRLSDQVGVLRTGAGAYEVRLDHPPQSTRRPGSWSVTLYSPEGDTLQHRRYAWEHQERRGEWRRSHLRSQTSPRSPDSALDAVERTIRSLGPTGMLVSPVEAVESTQDGRLWIRRDPGPDTVEWIALDAELNPEFRLHLPRGYTIAASHGGRLVTSQGSTLQVPSIHLYRIPEQPAER